MARGSRRNNDRGRRLTSRSERDRRDKRDREEREERRRRRERAEREERRKRREKEERERERQRREDRYLLEARREREREKARRVLRASKLRAEMLARNPQLRQGLLEMKQAEIKRRVEEGRKKLSDRLERRKRSRFDQRRERKSRWDQMPEKKSESGREEKKQTPLQRAQAIRDEIERKIAADKAKSIEITLLPGQSLSQNLLNMWKGKRVVVTVYRVDASGVASEVTMTLTQGANSAQQSMIKTLKGQWWNNINWQFDDDTESEKFGLLRKATRITQIDFKALPEPKRTDRVNQAVAKCPILLNPEYMCIEKELEKAQIYVKGGKVEHSSKQCLINALVQQGLDEQKVRALCMKYTFRRNKGTGWEESTSMHFAEVLREVSDVFELQIEAKYMKKSTKGKFRIVCETIGDQQEGEVIQIGAFENHAFWNYDIQVSSLFLKNPAVCIEALKKRPTKSPREPKHMCKIRSNQLEFMGKKQKHSVMAALLKIINNGNYEVMQGSKPIHNSAQVSALPELTSFISQKKVKPKKATPLLQAFVLKKVKLTSYFSYDSETDINGPEQKVILTAFDMIPKLSVEVTYVPKKKGETVYVQRIFMTKKGKARHIFNGDRCVKEIFNEMCRKSELKSLRSDEPEIMEELVERYGFDYDKLKVRFESACVVFAHNVKFDLGVMKEDLPTFKNLISKGISNIYGASFYIKRVEVQLKDSAKYLPWALKETQKNLNLPLEYSKKDLAAYSFFNKDRVRYDAPPVEVEDYVDCYNRDNPDRPITLDHFLGEVTKVNGEFKTLSPEGKECPVDFLPVNPETGRIMFDANSYYRYYLIWDCKILSAGLLKLDEVLQNDLARIAREKGRVLKIPSLFDNIIFTIPGFAREFFTRNGALDGTYQVVGHAKEFIHESFFGGRVVSNKTDSKEKNQYHDACSLYPTALCEMIEDLKGITTGEATTLLPEECTKEFLATVKNYTVRVEFTKMTKQQTCGVGPLPQRMKDGKVVYHTKWPGAPFTGVYGKILLEDSAEILGADYKILEGVYWDDRSIINTSYKELTEFLYEARMIYKKSNKALATAIKLILNSGCYGCLARKPCYTKNVLKSEEEKLQYMANHFDEMVACRPLSKNNVLFQMKCADENYTSVKIACDVLDQSKKIMNRMFTACSQEGAEVSYSDTDSFVIPVSKETKIIQRFEENNPGKIYAGTALGQFHSDFDVPKEAEAHGLGSEHTQSVQFYNLGKKLYLHLLEAVDPKTKRVYRGYKLTCKGFVKHALVVHAQRHFGIQEPREALAALFRDASENNAEHKINMYPSKISRIEYNMNFTPCSVPNTGKTAFFRVFKKLTEEEEEQGIDQQESDMLVE